MNPEFLLFMIKILCGGIVAFLAIFLMSKTREISWVFLITGFLLSYIATVYESLLSIGVVTDVSISVGGIPLISFLSAVIPTLCFIIGLILRILRK